MPADLLTFEKVKDGTATLAQLKAAVAVGQNVALNRKFIEGDHWQNGDAWPGPGPQPGDPEYAEVMRMIEKVFVSRNIIDEVTDRLMSSVVGKEPRWTWAPDRPMEPDETPKNDEQMLISEVNAAISNWWNKRQIHALLKSLIYKMLFGQRCVWRVYIPTGLAPNGSVAASDLRAALELLYLDIPEPEAGGVWEDPETKQRVGIVVYKNDGDTTEHTEVSWVDTDGKTYIRLDNAAPIPNDYSGALPIFEVALPSEFVSEQLRSLQRMLNMTLTLLGKGLVDNHFLERLIFGALPPGHWEYEDLPNEAGQKVRKAYIPAPHVTGGRMTSYIQGVDYETEPGKTAITTPSAVFRDPTDPGGTIKGADFWYGAMLDESRQSHVIVNQSSTIGFKSREQARGDFIDSTHDVQLQTENGGEELLRVIVKIGEAIAGQRGKYTKVLKPVFKVRPNYGPLTVEERTQNISEAKDGYMADETAMSLNGIDDTDAERAAIAAQPRAALALDATSGGGEGVGGCRLHARGGVVNDRARSGRDFPDHEAEHRHHAGDRPHDTESGRLTKEAHCGSSY
jgi:hypothetical protein